MLEEMQFEQLRQRGLILQMMQQQQTMMHEQQSLIKEYQSMMKEYQDMIKSLHDSSVIEEMQIHLQHQEILMQEQRSMIKDHQNMLKEQQDIIKSSLGLSNMEGMNIKLPSAPSRPSLQTQNISSLTSSDVVVAQAPPGKKRSSSTSPVLTASNKQYRSEVTVDGLHRDTTFDQQNIYSNYGNGSQTDYCSQLSSYPSLMDAQLDVKRVFGQCMIRRRGGKKEYPHYLCKMEPSCKLHVKIVGRGVCRFALVGNTNQHNHAVSYGERLDPKDETATDWTKNYYYRGLFSVLGYSGD
jgi:hypothetical protein